jgi:hypothetical protein
MRAAHRRGRHGGRGLGDTAPNFVEPANNPDQSSPWATNYAAPAPAPTGTITFGPLSIKPAAPKTKALAKAPTAKASTGKVALKRTGTAGAILDKLLPLMVDAAGKQTIFGLNPALVYVAGGVLSASVLALLLRFLRGGVGRVSNPKRIAARRAKP